MSFQIYPLSTALGAEVVGLDLAESLDDETFACVHQAHLDHQVLVFRDQHLTPAHHVAFSRRFGELSEHVYDQFLLPGYPEILKVSNKKTADGDFAGLASAGRRWHSDLSYAKTPSYCRRRPAWQNSARLLEGVAFPTDVCLFST